MAKPEVPLPEPGTGAFSGLDERSQRAVLTAETLIDAANKFISDLAPQPRESSDHILARMKEEAFAGLPAEVADLIDQIARR